MGSEHSSGSTPYFCRYSLEQIKGMSDRSLIKIVTAVECSLKNVPVKCCVHTYENSYTQPNKTSWIPKDLFIIQFRNFRFYFLSLSWSCWCEKPTMRETVPLESSPVSVRFGGGDPRWWIHSLFLFPSPEEPNWKSSYAWSVYHFGGSSGPCLGCCHGVNQERPPVWSSLLLPDEAPGAHQGWGASFFTLWSPGTQSHMELWPPALGL